LAPRRADRNRNNPVTWWAQLGSNQ
jgi:hypothetical protein